MNKARDVKGNEERFLEAQQQQKTRENPGSLMNGSGDLILKNMEKASAKVQGQVNLPSVEEDQVRDYFNKLDTQKSPGPAGMYLQVLMALCQLSSKGRGGWGRFLRTGRKQMSL